MSRKVKCADCGEYHTEITIPSWLELPLNYMLMLAGPDAGTARIEVINEMLAEPDERRMSMVPLAHFVLHCAQGAATCSRTWGGKYKNVLDWNAAILAVLQHDMTHFVQNDDALRLLALAHPKDYFEVPNPFASAPEGATEEWYRDVVRAHFYATCLDMVSHDEMASGMFAVMAAALIGNNSLALTRARFHVSEDTAIGRVDMVIGEYRRVAMETLDSVISSFQTGKIN